MVLLYAADAAAVALLTAVAEWGAWQWTAGAAPAVAVGTAALIAMCAGMSLPLVHAQLRRNFEGPASAEIAKPAVEDARLANEVAALRARIDRLPNELAEAMLRQARMGIADAPRHESQEGDIARYIHPRENEER